jgi:15-cis-phytoene synthase
MDTSTQFGLWASLECNPCFSPDSPHLKYLEINSFTNHDTNRFIADLVGSSHFQAISDDAAKDEDNAGWVIQLEPAIRDQWIERIRWIRLVDRLAEQELLYPDNSVFSQFLADWQHLCTTGCVSDCSAYQAVLRKMQSLWLTPSSKNGSTPPDLDSLQAWQNYLGAIAAYHSPDLVIETVDQYEQILEHLAGSFFQILPFLAPHQQQAARAFGMVDQFYNHLRDLQEDAESGICYLPTELLDRYGVRRADLLTQCAHHQANYAAMMEFWLDQYLPKLWQHGHALLDTTDLHPSWQLMRSWSVQRYCRIEMVFRNCHFDYTQFPQHYWQQVRHDLPIILKNTEKSHLYPQPVSKPLDLHFGLMRGWKKYAHRSQSLACCPQSS